MTPAHGATGPADGGGLPRRWSLRARLVVSGLLALHLLSVVVGPWSGPPPASQLAQAVARVLAPYLYAIHLNHGYRFFAPNPGPSHLVRYEVQRADGTRLAGRFPDPASHWPRQLYHRHFMISESMYGLSERVLEAPTAPQPIEHVGVPAEIQAEYEQAKLIYEREKAKSDALAASLARQLLAQFDGQQVKLWVVEHGIPVPQLVQQGVLLDDPSLYRERPLGEWDRN
jgi:hypothetical protein